MHNQNEINQGLLKTFVTKTVAWANTCAGQSPDFIALWNSEITVGKVRVEIQDTETFTGGRIDLGAPGEEGHIVVSWDGFGHAPTNVKSSSKAIENPSMHLDEFVAFEKAVADNLAIGLKDYLRKDLDIEERAIEVVKERDLNHGTNN